MSPNITMSSGLSRLGSFLSQQSNLSVHSTGRWPAVGGFEEWFWGSEDDNGVLWQLLEDLCPLHYVITDPTSLQQTSFVGLPPVHNH